MDATRRELLLADAFLSAHDVGPQFVREISPYDEMYQHARSVGTPAERRRLVYFKGGHDASTVIRHTLRAAGKNPSSVASYLDFACGYGRVARFVVRWLCPSRIWVSDIDAAATEFVADRMGVTGFPSCTDPADLALDREFEVIFVGSLFSHLPRERFRSWLQKLYGHLAPEGVLLFSTHGMDAFPQFRSPSGYEFIEKSETSRLDGREYGSTFVSPSWVGQLSREIGIVECHTRARGLWYSQDLHVAVKTPNSGLRNWTQAPVIRGEISAIEFHGTRAAISGSAHLPRQAGEIQEITVTIDGLGSFPAPFRRARPGPRADSASSMRDYEWRVEGEVAHYPPGVRTVRISGRVADHPPSCFEVGVIEFRDDSTARKYLQWPGTSSSPDPRSGP